METINIKDLVNNNQQVTFLRYQNNELWYITDTGFEFPVPLSDTGGAIFLPKDKALVFMRWIRKQISYIDSARNS